MKVYIVISDTVIYEHESHGLHGAYHKPEKARSTAISVIKSIAKNNYFDVNDSDIINEDDTEFSYQNDTLGIWVSCIEQEVY